MMGLTENQLEVTPLDEDNLSYDPSKIDEFVIEAKKDIEMGKNLISKFGSMLVNTPLISLYENIEKAKEAEKKISDSVKYLNSKYNKFYDIVEMYELGEYPDNVNQLYDLGNAIDNLSGRLSDLGDALEAFMDMIEKISKYNAELLTTQNFN